MIFVDIKNKIKSSRFLYIIYFYFGNLLLKILKLFVKTDNKLILFVSYGGRKYDDSPQNIYEAMTADSRFEDYKFVWGFEKPDNFQLIKGEKISINSVKYLVYALKARVWVTNVDMRRGLNFDVKHTIYVNTWHGTAIKYLGNDCSKEGQEFNTKAKRVAPDIMLAQGEHDVNVYISAFNLSRAQIALTGLPRNDALVAFNNIEYRSRLKKKMGLPNDKIIILYAPTFREYDGMHNWEQELSLNLEKWTKSFGNKYQLLIRGHQVVQTMTGITDGSFVKDYTGYPNLNDLLLVSDILISDYSSIFFDYSILGRPMFCYAYDYEKYYQNRGLYFDIRKELSCAEDEDELITKIETIDWDVESHKAAVFRDRYVQYFGNATSNSLDIIYKKMQTIKI